MAKIAILTDTNVPIGTPRAIPDTAIPLLRIIFGGATNADTANAVLDWIMLTLYHYAKERKKAMRRATDQQAVESGQVAEDNDFTLTWPEPVVN